MRPACAPAASSMPPPIVGTCTDSQHNFPILSERPENTATAAAYMKTIDPTGKNLLSRRQPLRLHRASLRNARMLQVVVACARRRWIFSTRQRRCPGLSVPSVQAVQSPSDIRMDICPNPGCLQTKISSLGNCFVTCRRPSYHWVKPRVVVVLRSFCAARSCRQQSAWSHRDAPPRRRPGRPLAESHFNNIARRFQMNLKRSPRVAEGAAIILGNREVLS
jgi:hypothetical protein